MRKLEQYRVKDGKTSLSAEELNFRFFDLDGRLHQLELLKISWQEAVAEVQNHGLERINTVIQPILDQAGALVAEAQAEIDAIKTEWQGILDEWADVADELAGMQANLDAMQADIDAAEAAITTARDYADAQIAAAIPVAAIPLKFWQTDPDQYTVLAQDADNYDGIGQDLFYKYVFPAGVGGRIYTEVVLPFSGYDLQAVFRYRMSTSAAGVCRWILYYRAASTNENNAEWASFSSGTFDSYVQIYDTPSASANQSNLISGSDLVIPASAFSAYDKLMLSLSLADSGTTHTGDAEVDDSIMLVPVLA